MKERTKILPADLRRSENKLTALYERYKSYIYKYAFLAFLSFMFGRAELMFETFPLGIAFVCAVRDGVPFAAAGLALSAVIKGGDAAVMSIAGMIVSVGFRYTMSFVLRKKGSSLLSLSDGIVPRASSAAVGAFTSSFIRIIYGGFRYYDLLAAGFSVLCAAAAVYAYSLFLDPEYRRTERFEAGLAAVMYSAVVSVSGISVFGISASGAAAFILTLTAAGCKGAMKGVVAGFLCGAAIDISLCPMYGLTGFLCGLLSSVSPYIGIVFSLTAGMFCGLQTGGFETLTSNLPEAVVAACTVLPMEYFGVLRRVRASAGELAAAHSSRSEAYSYEAAVDAVRVQMRRLSDAYKSISELSYEISAAEQRPDSSTVTRICGNVFREFCADCPKREDCFDGGEPSQRLLSKLSSAFMEKRSLRESDLPDRLKKICPYPGGLAVKADLALAGYMKSSAECDKAGVVADQAQSFSKLLYGISAYMPEKLEKNKEVTEKLVAVPAFAELFGTDITVCGRDRLSIACSSPDVIKLRQNADKLRRMAEKATGRRLSEPQVVQTGEGAVFTAESEAVFYTQTEIMDMAKENELCNGDSSFYTYGGDGKFYCAVCDGMGSGKSAAVTSKLCSIALGKLLYATGDVPAALDQINKLIRHRRTECFSTLDLFEFDTQSGAASFYKCGAAPTVIIRRGKAYKLASHTPPLGIMTKMNSERIDLELSDGDTVVMMSDGITSSTEDISWICELLCGAEGQAPDELCGTLLSAAKERSGGADDMTVAVILIKKRK